jgi:hypothetical protein
MSGPALSKNQEPDFIQRFRDEKMGIVRTNQEWQDYAKDNPLLEQRKNPWETEKQYYLRTQKTEFDQWESKNAQNYPKRKHAISI